MREQGAAQQMACLHRQHGTMMGYSQFERHMPAQGSGRSVAHTEPFKRPHHGMAPVTWCTSRIVYEAAHKLRHTFKRPVAHKKSMHS